MSSTILRTGNRLILPLTFLFAAYMWLKGHNEPGGGFIAGMIFSVGILLYRMSNGPEAFCRLVPVHPRWLVFYGLGLALFTAIVPMLLGYPFLTSHTRNLPLGFGQEIHFTSALFFDTGVMLVVVGVSVGMIQRLSEELNI